MKNNISRTMSNRTTISVILVVLVITAIINTLVFFNFDTNLDLNEDAVFIISMLLALPLLCIFIAFFNKVLYPYLNLYPRFVFLIPYANMVAYLLVVNAMRFMVGIVVALVIYYSVVVISALVIFISFKRVSAIPKITAFKSILSCLIVSDEAELNSLKKARKSDIIVLFAVEIILVISSQLDLSIMKYLALPMQLILMLTVFIKALPIYKIKYKTLSRLVLNLIIDFIVFITITVFLLLCLYNVIAIELAVISTSFEVALGTAFSLLGFIRHYNYCIHIERHNKLRQEINSYLGNHGDIELKPI